MLPIVKLDRGFAGEDVEKLVARSLEAREEVEKSVSEIIQDVRERGDEALIDQTARLDGYRLAPEEIKIDSGEIKRAYESVSRDFVEAIRLSAERVRRYHERQRRSSWFEIEDGSLFGQLVLPIERVGIYVPGGRAAYPSTVVMTAVPARVAGVAEIAMCVPAPPGKTPPEVLVAASEAGVDEVYRVGGAQAIAAMAYGTSTIRKVDKIVGPGNIYVTLAKKMVVGAVDIDMLAGPSEVVVVADDTASPALIAADLLAQAEHDPDASAILITTDENLANDVNLELAFQSKSLERRKVAESSLKHRGRIFVVDDLEEAIRASNAIAPEHLELYVEDPYRALGSVKSAGAIFLGEHAPEALGDYVAGPSHVLPTGGTARFYSPLSVDTFLKQSSIIAATQELLKKIGPAAAEIATREGFQAHARSIEKRLEKRRT